MQQMVEEEKEIMNERFSADIQRLQETNMKQVQALEHQAIQYKNKNEKFERNLIEKEATILEL